MNTGYLIIKDYKSCCVILSRKTDLALCNRINCPIYKKPQCRNCRYRIFFYSNKDKVLIKMALSMLGLLYTEYIPYQLPKLTKKSFFLKKKIRIKSCKDFSKRLDLNIKTFMFKALKNLSIKYEEHIQTVDTIYSDIFSIRVDVLSREFLDVDSSLISFRPKIFKDTWNYF